MTAGQASSGVPLWVPLLVAGVGLLGVLGAQALAAWREDRRWSREREREDLRWTRERAERQEQWRREDTLRSYEHRQGAYAVLIAAIDAWNDSLRSAVAAYKVDGSSTTSEEDIQLREWEKEARRAFGLVNLVAPEYVRSAARATLVRMSFLRLLLSAEDLRSTDSAVPAASDLSDKAEVYLLARVRQDLGIDDDQDEPDTLPSAEPGSGRSD